MGIKEIIRWIEFTKNQLAHAVYPNDKRDAALGEALLLLSKQLPKKPDYEGDGYADGELIYDTWICPYCGKHYEVDYDNYDYCPNCGQKLDLRYEE